MLQLAVHWHSAHDPMLLVLQIMMEGEEEEGSDNIGGQSRDIGSLTGWQALANEVIAELGSGPQPASQQAMGSGRSMGDSEENMQVHVALHECMLCCSVQWLLPLQSCLCIPHTPQLATSELQVGQLHVCLLWDLYQRTWLLRGLSLSLLSTHLPVRIGSWLLGFAHLLSAGS